MQINKGAVAKYLKEFDFASLFISELGWDNVPKSQLNIKLREDDDISYIFSPIAHKRGMIAYLYEDNDKLFPDYSTRRKLERKVAKSAHEHIIIYLNRDDKTQIWQWVKAEAGKPSACREHKVHEQQSGEALIQKLEQIAFSLDEEEQLTLLDVTSRIRAGFDVEKVTKKFYERFKKEHDKFVEFIEGIPDEDDEQWYASIMMNRLMFTYFIQKKGFLDGDVNYLRNRLKMVKEQGKDKFYSFYRSFLRQLFHEGLDKKKSDRTIEINKLIGEIPYLNGGIFHTHELEEKYSGIDIDDEVFQKIFDFFDEYDWHLDERPLHKEKEINPDVLGYIFEKYINQKQMGAYYTKEDITGYISKNTIIPRLFEMVKEKCKIAFEGEHAVWDLLHENPDRYIYPTVRHGISYDIHEDKELEKALELPDDIQIGVNTEEPELLKRREKWNKAAPQEYALPTEIWREVVARRQRHDDVWLKLAGREIIDINDLITHNLDICQFAQDVIESSEGPALVRAFYHSIEKITVLDPTCGSGAFLFAALNILEPLYEACLDRMKLFIDDLDSSDEKHRSDKYSDFRKILLDVDKHPSPRYFVYKSIILNNLYGVDIMDEAVEICKLRLFLKLMAQVECDRTKNNMGVEALPDVDFNVRAGNSLVGFTNYKDVKLAIEGKDQGMFDFDNTMEKINKKAEEVKCYFELFRKMQTQHDMSSTEFADAKVQLRQRLSELEDELNGYLSKQYGVDKTNHKEYDSWLTSHKPFHWYVDFYGIVHGNGGFDVIVGNPPYVEYRKVVSDYKVLNCELTASCGNLHAFFQEKTKRLLSNFGKSGLIVPMSSISSNRMSDLMNGVILKYSKIWLSHYPERPCQLFVGARPMVTIVLADNFFTGSFPKVYSSTLHRWYKDARNVLFPLIKYACVYTPSICNYTVPKQGNSLDLSIAHKVYSIDERLGKYLMKKSDSEVLYNRSFLYWLKSFTFHPKFSVEGSERKNSDDHQKSLFVSSDSERNLLSALLNSSLLYWYTIKISNGREITGEAIKDFPFSFAKLEAQDIQFFDSLANDLMDDLRRNSHVKTTLYKKVGTISYQEFFFAPSKGILDKIDQALGCYYGFTEEELDYIINYDIKYRMGKELKSDE